MDNICSQKRIKFRQQIRRRQIQQMKRQKRKLILQKYEKDKQKQKIHQQQVSIYIRILTHSHQIFQQPQHYLQLLRQSLNWGYIAQYNNLFPDILLNVLKFYQQCTYCQNTLILLLQCISLLFYENDIAFVEMSKQSLRICYEQFIKHVPINSRQSALIINRCLVSIQNITYHTNQQLLKLFKQLQILQRFQQLIQDHPFTNTDKDHMLGIYENVINYHIYSQQLIDHQYAYYYPMFIEACITQTDDTEILAKVTMILYTLIRNRMCDWREIAGSVRGLLFYLELVGCYVGKMEYMVAEVVEYVAQEAQANTSDGTNNDMEQLMHRIYNMLDQLTTKYIQQACPQQIAKIFQWFIAPSNPIVDIQLTLNLVKKLCNYWVDCSDISTTPNPSTSTNNFQLHCLKFLNMTVSSIQVCSQLYNELQSNIQQDNAIKAPTWQIILQFLNKVELQGMDKQLQYLHLVQKLLSYDMVTQYYRSSIMEKIEGICNCVGIDERICKYAGRVLDLEGYRE